MDYCYHTSKASSYLSACSGRQSKAQCVNEGEIERFEKRTSVSMDSYQIAFVVLLGRVLDGQQCCLESVCV